MKAEIISVGTELLLGEIVNTDAQFIASQLKLCGFSADYQSTVGDNPTDLKKALALALERSDVIILTGGLGPTDDDITLPTVCKALGIEQQLHQPTADKIKSYFESTGRQMPESNLKQAMLPKDAVIFDNDCGTAPGCAITAGGQWIIMLPGVPKELTSMFTSKVEPFLKQMSDEVFVSKTVRIFGIGESAVAEKLGSEMFERENPIVGIYCQPGEVKLRVCAKSDNAVAAEALCKPVINKIKATFGNSVYSTDDRSLEETVVSLLRENGMTVATAESCTAGLISKRITDVQGSSQVFSMGVTAYSAQTKEQLLSVPPSVIARNGTVCKEVAVYMALGVKNKSNADLGVGITGVAGGKVEGKPNGLVYVAVTDGNQYWCKQLQIGHGTDDERDYVRQVASSYALDMVRKIILGCEENAKPLKLRKPQAEKPVQVAPAVTVAPVVEEPPVEQPAAPTVIEIEQPIEPPPQETPVLSEERVTEVVPAPITRMKKGKAGKVFKNILLVLSIITLVISAAYITNYYVRKFNNDHLMTELRDQYQPEQTGVDDAGIQIKFLKLLEGNSDIKGWLTIPNSNVDNPVYQSEDNDFYVNHDAEKQKSVYGALFADYKDDIGQNSMSKNICIYGHHMKDGTMLADLHKYKDIDFYKQSPVISFDTLYTNNDYKVFAAFITNADTRDDNDYFFDYTASSFSTTQDFTAWIEQVKARSLYSTNVDIEPTDSILTLSTCTYEINDVELRFVVCARRVRSGEDLSVDTSAAQVNPSPIYPQVWYDHKGGKKPENASSQWYGSLMSEYVVSKTDEEQARIESQIKAESERIESERLESERLESERVISEMIASLEAESQRNASIAAMISSEEQNTSSEQPYFYVNSDGNVVIDKNYFDSLSAYSVVTSNSDN